MTVINRNSEGCFWRLYRVGMIDTTLDIFASSRRNRGGGEKIKGIKGKSKKVNSGSYNILLYGYLFLQ